MRGHVSHITEDDFQGLHNLQFIAFPFYRDQGQQWQLRAEPIKCKNLYSYCFDKYILVLIIHFS